MKKSDLSNKASSASLGPIEEGFHSMELFFRGVTRPTSLFKRDPLRKEKVYPAGFTYADQELMKTSRRGDKSSKQGNPARSLSLLGRGGKVFSPVGGGILRKNLELVAAYPIGIGSGFGPKHQHRKTPPGHDIEEGLEETKKFFKTGEEARENPEAIANIKAWDCILYTTDPLSKIGSSDSQRFLEAVFLRDVYQKYYQQTLPIYRFSTAQQICQKVEVTDESILSAYEQIFQEQMKKVENILSISQLDIDVWIITVAQHGQGVSIDTHASPALKTAIRQRLEALRLKMVKANLMQAVKVHHYQGLMRYAEISPQSRALVQSCVKSWVDKELTKVNVLNDADELYQMLNEFGPQSKANLKAYFLIMLKQTIKQFIQNSFKPQEASFSDLLSLKLVDLVNLMISKQIIRIKGFYTHEFHDSLVSSLKNDHDFKVSTLYRQALETYEFPESKEMIRLKSIDFNLEILEAMVFNNYFQPTVSRVILATFNNMVGDRLSPEVARSRVNILISIIENENRPLYQQLIKDELTAFLAEFVENNQVIALEMIPSFIRLIREGLGLPPEKILAAIAKSQLSPEQLLEYYKFLMQNQFLPPRGPDLTADQQVLLHALQLQALDLAQNDTHGLKAYFDTYEIQLHDLLNHEKKNLPSSLRPNYYRARELTDLGKAVLNFKLGKGSIDEIKRISQVLNTEQVSNAQLFKNNHTLGYQ